MVKHVNVVKIKAREPGIREKTICVREKILWKKIPLHSSHLLTDQSRGESKSWAPKSHRGRMGWARLSQKAAWRS